MTIRAVQPEALAFLKFLVFAPSKHGKTSLIGTAQEDERTSPVLLLDFEGNTQSLVGLPIDVVPVRSWADFNEAYAFLRTEDHSKLPGSTLPSGGKYKTIALDSITEINFYALSAELIRQGTTGKGREEGPLGPDAAQIQDFGRVLTQMRRLLRLFRDLPAHIIYTALDDQEAAPGEGTVKLPNMIGKMQREVGAFVDIVGYLAIQGDEEHRKRVLLLHDIERYRVGIREEWKKWGTVPQTLEEPTIGKLMDTFFPRPKVVAQKEAS